VRSGPAEYAMTVGRPLVLVAGAASRDVTPADPRGWRLGGAVAFGALTLARLGLRVRAAIGVDDAASGAIELDHLRAAGAELHLVPLASGPVFENQESADGRRQRCIASSDSVPLDALPSLWTRDLDAFFAAPVAGELGAAWTTIRAPVVALGWQGLLRDLRPGADTVRRPPVQGALLDAASLIAASRDDFAPGTTLASLARLLRPSTTLVLTDGENGGQCIRIGSDGVARPARRYPAIPSDRTVDPTGAGDVFLAALLATRLQRVPGSAARFAAAAASLMVEAPGLAGVPDLAAVRARMTRAPSLARRRPSAVSSRASGRPSQA
jgi:sugar/nucleoside kinase (ribokinase family)